MTIAATTTHTMTSVMTTVLVISGPGCATSRSRRAAVAAMTAPQAAHVAAVAAHAAPHDGQQAMATSSVPSRFPRFGISSAAESAPPFVNACTVTGQGILLVAAVVAVGVLHTMVPDHWAPIALLARQHGWSKTHVARTAAFAGLGHTVSTLIIAVIVWAAGAALAARFGTAMSLASGIALIAFGGWIAIAGLRELAHAHGHDHDHAHFGHGHLHRHPGGVEHRHWHEHHEADWHAPDDDPNSTHQHEHKTSSRTALLLILGSSPMIEGIPAFFAAGRYGVGLLVTMGVLFAASTILTYVALCTAATSGMQRLNLGRFEEYGEVVGGTFIAILGIVFLMWPI